MQVLVIDTHSSPTGVAIVEDEELVGEISIHEEYSQSDHLLPLIQDLFLRTNRKIESIDAFVVCKGPGSFTGLRIGMTTAKTFAQLYEKPVVGISTLEAIGAKFMFTGDIIPIVDGRGGNVYYAIYRWENGKLVQKRTPDFIKLDILLEETLEDVLFVGKDTKLFPQLKGRSAPHPQGSILSSLGYLALQRMEQQDYDDTFSLSPDYLRLSQAQRDYLKKMVKQQEK